MEKLYFLIPKLAVAKSIVSTLRTVGIDERHIHVVAKANVTLEQLPKALLLEDSDFALALKHGAAAGGTVGLLASLVAVAVPPAGIVLGGGALLGSTLAGATFGAWAASMIGISAPNSQLRQFEDALDQGALLMLIEAERERLEDIRQTVLQHHPKALFEETQDAAQLVHQASQ